MIMCGNSRPRLSSLKVIFLLSFHVAQVVKASGGIITRIGAPFRRFRSASNSIGGRIFGSNSNFNNQNGMVYYRNSFGTERNYSVHSGGTGKAGDHGDSGSKKCVRSNSWQRGSYIHNYKMEGLVVDASTTRSDKQNDATSSSTHKKAAQSPGSSNVLIQAPEEREIANYSAYDKVCILLGAMYINMPLRAIVPMLDDPHHWEKHEYIEGKGFLSDVNLNANASAAARIATITAAGMFVRTAAGAVLAKRDFLSGGKNPLLLREYKSERHDYSNLRNTRALYVITKSTLSKKNNFSEFFWSKLSGILHVKWTEKNHKGKTQCFWSMSNSEKLIFFHQNVQFKVLFVVPGSALKLRNVEYVHGMFGGKRETTTQKTSKPNSTSGTKKSSLHSSTTGVRHFSTTGGKNNFGPPDKNRVNGNRIQHSGPHEELIRLLDVMMLGASGSSTNKPLAYYEKRWEAIFNSSLLDKIQYENDQMLKKLITDLDGPLILEDFEEGELFDLSFDDQLILVEVSWYLGRLGIYKIPKADRLRKFGHIIRLEPLSDAEAVAFGLPVPTSRK